MHESTRPPSPFGFRAAIGPGRPAADRTNTAAAGLLICHAALYLALEARLGVAGTVLWYVGPSLLAALAGILLLVSLVSAMRHRLTWNRERLLRYVLLVAATAAPAAYRTYPSSFDGRPSATRVVLPLDGPVTVAWGGEARSANLHVVAPDQRWGFDLLVTVDRRSYRADGTHLADYFVYGREVRAPAAGIVRTVHDQEPDVAIGGRDRGDDLGNHLSLEVGPGEFMYLAHMQPGSIRPKPGDRVRPGDVLGLVGNSGNSQEPHVHVHLQNSNRRHFAEGVPFAFSDYCAGGTLVRQGIPEGGHTGKAWIGEIIETAPASGCDAVASVGGRRRSARPEAMALYPRLRYLSP